ncbi:Acyl-CoA N-acyltransferase [Tylopilus felleus]
MMNLTIQVPHLNDGEAMRQCSLRICPLDTCSMDRYVRVLSMWPELSRIAVNDKDEIVGTCLVGLKEAVKDATHAHVAALFVLPGYQGQGVGRRLLETSLQTAKTQFNVSEVTLYVRKTNEPAIGLYTSIKFYTTDMRSGFYSDGEDGLIMNLLLTDDVNT